MQLRSSTVPLILFTVACPFLSVHDTWTPSHDAQAPAARPDTYAQITSVTVEPSSIHKAKEPSETTVIIQILLQGEAPPDPEVKLDVSTYSSDPPNNTLRFDDPTRKVALREGLTTVRAKAESTPETTAGKIRIIADITQPTKGVNIKAPDPPENGIAELTIVDP
jgi:hypothetical protein